MSQVPGKPVTRSGRAVTRRDVILRRLRSDDWIRTLMRSPNFGWAVVIALTAWVLAGLLATWARERPLIAVGQVMSETAIARVPVRVPDVGETQRKRDLARLKTARVYTPQATLAELSESLSQLPKALSTAEKLDDVAPSIRSQFGLTEEGLQAARTQVDAGQVSPIWEGQVARFIAALEHTPIIEDRAWQVEMQEGPSSKVELLRLDRTSQSIASDALVNLKDNARVRTVAQDAAQRTGMGPALAELCVARLLAFGRATHAFDEAVTLARQATSVDRVAPVEREIARGQTIYQRGEALTTEQYETLMAERAAFRSQAPLWRLALRPAGVAGAVGAITLAACGYLALFCRPIRQNPARMAVVAAMMVAALAVAAFASVAAPSVLVITAITPTLLLAAMLAVAYDQRVALAIGGLHTLLVCIALGLSVSMLALILTGVGVLVWHLRDIRDRRSIVRAAAWTAFSLVLGVTIVSMIDRPLVPAMVRQIGWEAVLAGLGGLLVAGVVFFTLPMIERWFDVTTGLTLIELRDPRQPLLRQLQQNAPGTYNHSLNVASIAEAAAEAIGADSLLTYVGAMYHDIGKMNKPDYFIENQSGGPNRHDKLSPAMSLLVIVGHVKDGIAMAEEAGLPKPLRHFIEAHHGTTVVEYFYTRARQQARASGDEDEAPEEIEYRYPGPKPRTKEVAILMLADAVESATRSMAEPTPGRIDAIVRAIANARLMDGQFDDCELSLRELHQIAESISKTVAAIYHGRVKYPTAEAAEPKTAAEKRA